MIDMFLHEMFTLDVSMNTMLYTDLYLKFLRKWISNHSCLKYCSGLMLLGLYPTLGSSNSSTSISRHRNLLVLPKCVCWNKHCCPLVGEFIEPQTTKKVMTTVRGFFQWHGLAIYFLVSFMFQMYLLVDLVSALDANWNGFPLAVE